MVTTGIYCRPGCGARPRSDHVVRFGSAAAAEAAGYRACLRCRPYRAPIQAINTGPDLVCRAVQLVLDGALDSATESTLATRLGVSARHLRRLFDEHLGVTPDGLARSVRTHFARRLLDDTDLSIADVAFAAGFGSVRQLNRCCLQVFRKTPTELRARRRRADRLTADGGLVLRLPYHGPLDWDAMLDLLAERSIPGVEYVDDHVYRRTIAVEGDPGVLEVSSGGHDHLLLRLHLPRWHELVHVVGRARRLANLDIDLAAAHRRLGTDPIIGPLIDARPGLRPPGAWNPFEVGVQTIVEEYTSSDIGQRILRRLVNHFGTPAPGLTQLGLTHTFPSAAALGVAPPSDLGLAPEAVQALRDFSRAVTSGRLRLDGSVPLDQLLAELSVGGIGPAAAAYIALRVGETNAYPPCRGDYEDESHRWSPWRALAATHLGPPGHLGALRTLASPAGSHR